MTTQMVSKNSYGKLMQACNACASCRVIFIATRTAQCQQINNGISKPVSSPSLFHSIRGISAHCHCPPLANHIEKPTTVSLYVVLCCLPPFPMFSHCSHFQLKFSSTDCINGLPLVHMGITAHCLRPHAHKCHREANNGELIFCFYSLPPIPNIISHQPFSINLLFCRPRRPPSLCRQGE